MLESLCSLGKALNDDKGIHSQNMSSLVTPVHARHIIGIVFQNKNGTIKYKDVQSYDFQESAWYYLFKRDYSGRPGLFLTGSISRQDIQKVQLLLKNPFANKDKIQKFIDSKILWFPSGKLVNNNNLIKTLTSRRRQELSTIFQELTDKHSVISRIVLDDLEKNTAERTLVTIMLQEADDDPKFIGQIEDYREFFKRGVLAKRDTGGIENNIMICSVCNDRKIIDTFIEKPLPFFVADKPMFFPNADPSQATKGFSLCDDCYLELQSGTQFITDKLNYSIPSLGSKRPELSFWLIPHLNDLDLLIGFKNELKNGDLYLNKLKDLCETLKEITRSDPHENTNLEYLLRFSALFYRMDSHALMRVSNYIQGIYPSQLQRLFNIKEKVDNLYPYHTISEIYEKKDFYVGLPLIVLFYKGVSMQWESQTIELLESMFTGQIIALDQVVENIVTVIRESAKSYNFKAFNRIVFLGMMLLEYLINLNQSAVGEGNDMTQQEQGQDQHPIIEDVENVQKFIVTHGNLLVGDIERAIFAVGISVGVLLEVQAQRYNKTAPFWGRLNRLDLDIDRIIPLYAEVKSKLAMYGERGYNTILNYLGTNEISRMNPAAKISKNNLNFIFSIGLSYGYMLKRGYLK